MEAIKKQASKLREQVAKQQQALLRQLKHFGGEAVTIDEADIQCHKQLENLYFSTRAAKHFQRNVVHGSQSFISLSSKQIEIVQKLAEDCRKYGVENQESGSLARVALCFGSSHTSMESEHSKFLETLRDQVCKPLREMISAAPLEDARHLAHRYEKLRQEVESQEAEVVRRRSKSRDSAFSAESSVRLQSAEERLNELKSTMTAIGREAIGAMISVEDQQQKATFLRLLRMVDAERSYHKNVLSILEKLHAETILAKQLNESSLQTTTMPTRGHGLPLENDINSDGFGDHDDSSKHESDFVGKVIHPFEAQMDGELSLSMDDIIAVRQVTSTGWSEGECNGKAGWFPSAYVERLNIAAPDH